MKTEKVKKKREKIPKMNQMTFPVFVVFVAFFGPVPSETRGTQQVKWTRYGDFKLPWNETSRFCAERGSHLPVVSSKLAMNGMEDAVRSNFNSTAPFGEDFWTGLHSVQRNKSDYAWEKDCMMQAEFLDRWETDEPNLFNSQLCVRMTHDTCVWLTKECGTEYSVICESVTGSCTFEQRQDVTMAYAPDALADASNVTACQSLCLQLIVGVEECIAAEYIPDNGTCRLYLGCSLLGGVDNRTKSQIGATLQVRKCFSYETADYPTSKTPWPARGSCENRTLSETHPTSTQKVKWKRFVHRPWAPVSWNEASAFCHAERAHLPVLNTALAKNGFVQAAKRKFSGPAYSGTGGFWTGLHATGGGRYLWEHDCSNMADSMNAQFGNSAGSSNRSCVALIDTFTYQATECDLKTMEVVCESDMGNCTFTNTTFHNQRVSSQSASTINATDQDACKYNCLHPDPDLALQEECVAAHFNESSGQCLLYTGDNLATVEHITESSDGDRVTLFIRECFTSETEGLGPKLSNGPSPANGQCNLTDPELSDNIPDGVTLAPSCKSQLNGITYSKEGVEVVFVVDASDSISPENFTVLRQAIVDFIEPARNNKVDASVKVGFVVFGITNETTGLVSNSQSLNETVRNITHLGGETLTGTGISEGADLFSPTSLSKVMVVVAAGDSKDPCTTRQKAQETRRNNIDVIAVGMGGNVTQTELLRISGHPCRVHESAGFSRFPCLPLLKGLGHGDPCCGNLECGENMTCGKDNKEATERGACKCKDGFELDSIKQCVKKCLIYLSDCIQWKNNWTEADSKCQNNGGHLAVLNTGEEGLKNVIASICTTNMNDRFRVLFEKFAENVTGEHLGNNYSCAARLSDSAPYTHDHWWCLVACGNPGDNGEEGRRVACLYNATAVTNISTCLPTTETTTTATPTTDTVCSDSSDTITVTSDSPAPVTDLSTVTTTIFNQAWSSVTSFFTGESTTAPETSSTTGTSIEEAPISCDKATTNYPLTIGRIMSSGNLIEGKRFCKEEGLLFPVVESPQHLHTLTRCLCPPDERIPHYKRPKGFHVRLKLPEGTPVTRWEDVEGGFRYFCREFEMWNVYTHTCPNNYTIYKCSVDCTGEMELSITPVPYLCQKSGHVASKADCPPRRKCQPGENITSGCDPGKFPKRKCNCMKLDPNSTRLSEERKQQMREAIHNELLVDKSKLGKTIRKKISASDDRASATYSGYLGIAVLVIVFGGIFISDLPRLIKGPYRLWEEEKEARRAKRKKKQQEEMKQKRKQEKKKRWRERRAKRRQMQVSAV